MAIKWIEKWAEFNISDTETFKFICKFWTTSLTETQGEIKFQKLNCSILYEEITETCLIRKSISDV